MAAFHQASREHPRRLFYLARFTPGPTGEPDMAFAPADGPIERQEDRDAAWIRELGLEPLAYYWLYAKSFRTAAPQVKALRELLARVDPEELWRFLAWDGLLSRAVTGDEDGTTRYHPNKAEGVPDVVIQDLVRRFDRGILAGLTDGWGKEIGLLARQVAQKRSLPPG